MKSLRSKIVVFAVLSALLPSLGLGLMAFRYSHDVIDQRVAQELTSLASYARRELDLWIQERIRDIRSLSNSSVVIDGLGAAVRGETVANDGSAVAISELTLYLRSVRARLRPLLELSLVDVDGKLVASSAEQMPASMNLPAMWPGNALTAGVALMPPRWEDARAAPTLTMAVPVLSIDNELLGALVAVLDLRAVRLQTTDAVKQQGEVVVVDMHGRRLVGTLPAADRPLPLAADVLQRLQLQHGRPLAFQSFDQRTMIGVAETLRDRSLIIIAQKDPTEVYAAWSALRNQLLILIGGLSLLAGLLAYQSGRAIIAPLRRLIAAAERIADGDLAVQLPLARDDEIGRLTRAFNRMTEGLRRGRADIEAASQTLQQQNRLLERLSVTDALTGLYNRRKLDEILAQQIARYRRSESPFSVLMLDIDHFKPLNDLHGHLLGDEVLMRVAGILAHSIRNVDFAARYGGEEFVIVLIDTVGEGALETAERIRAKVAETHYGTTEPRVAVTVSIGVTTCREVDATAESVLARADQALYQAKQAGRNRVCCAA